MSSSGENILKGLVGVWYREVCSTRVFLRWEVWLLRCFVDEDVVGRYGLNNYSLYMVFEFLIVTGSFEIVGRSRG